MWFRLPSLSSASHGDDATPMPRLRRVDCSGPGIRRHRRGREFSYVDERGRRVADGTLERIRALAIPPAWEDVWICPLENGHIQAVGTDARGRRQYRYHDDWRRRRDREKFDQSLDFGRALPRLRRRVAGQVSSRGATRERVLAGAVRLLDRGFLPNRRQDLRRREQLVWPGDAAQAPRAARAAGRRRLRLSGQERQAQAPDRRRPGRLPSGRRAQGPPRRQRGAALPTRTGAAGTTCARPTSTSTSRR
jgi:hypothetical protein